MSGDQVAALLYGPTKEQLIAKGVPANEIAAAGLGLVPPKMTDGGKTGKVRGSTNDKCLENLLPLSPVVEHVMDFRQANKVKGTYVRPLRRLALSGDGRAHPGIKPTRVSSGRLATSDPNLLAIPVHWGIGTEVRKGFIADDGYILYDADLSQAEMRCAAHDSRDEKLCRVFWDKKDIHTMTACEMFSCSNPEAIEPWQRYASKQTGFGILNLISEFGLYDQMILYRAHKKDGSRWTIDECAELIATWFGVYKGVKRYHNDVIEEARQTGLSRESIGGRIRYVPGVWSPIGKIRGESEREACSHRIQSMAQSYMKKAMALMWPYLKVMTGVDVLLQCHDEILIQVPDDEDAKCTVDQIVTWAMSSAHELRVPMLAEGGYGANWLEAKH
jgi:DNA polymerase-1